jgi:hypothetical protein
MDERLLPYPEAVIKAALVRWIPKVSGDIRQYMENGLVTLAQFQPGVGKAQHVSGISPELLEATATTAKTDAQQAAKMIATAKQGHAAASDEVRAQVAAEECELLALCRSLR